MTIPVKVEDHTTIDLYDPPRSEIHHGHYHHHQDHRYLEQILDKILSRGPPQSSLGNPGPLGLAAFALTTFLLSSWNTGLLSKSTANIVLPVALWYGGIAQVLAGMWEFLANNTFGAVAFTSYGGFWLSFATMEQFWKPTGIVSEHDIHLAVGMYLLAWTIFTFYMTIGSFRMSVSLAIVFVLLEVTFILLTIGAYSANTTVTAVGGWFGLLTAGAAWYASSAILINNTYGVQLLPVGVIGPLAKKPMILENLKVWRRRSDPDVSATEASAASSV